MPTHRPVLRTDEGERVFETSEQKWTAVVDCIAAIPGFGEFNIGHSIVARATLVGMRTAVEQMKDLLYQYAPVELM